MTNKWRLCQAHLASKLGDLKGMGFWKWIEVEDEVCGVCHVRVPNWEIQQYMENEVSS